jgi:hypothetical protein
MTFGQVLRTYFYINYSVDDDKNAINDSTLFIDKELASPYFSPRTSRRDTGTGGRDFV